MMQCDTNSPSPGTCAIARYHSLIGPLLARKSCAKNLYLKYRGFFPGKNHTDQESEMPILRGRVKVCIGMARQAL